MKASVRQFLEDHPEGVSSRRLVEEVLKLRGAGDAVCDRVAAGAVTGVERAAKGSDGLWRIEPPAEAAMELGAARVAAVHWIAGRASRGRPVITEVAARRLDASGPDNCFASTVRPDVPVVAESLLASGLRLSELAGAPALQDVTAALREFCAGCVVTAFDGRGAEALLEEVGGGGGLCPAWVLPLRDLLSRLWPERDLSTLARAASLAGLPVPEVRRAAGELDIVAELYHTVVPALAERGIRTVEQAAAFAGADSFEPDFGRFGFDRAFLVALPERPGVYVMRDRDGGIVYIGKARSLRSRVGSYFAPGGRLDEKRLTILETVHTIDIEETGTEPEALIREADLIGRHRPPLNRQLAVHERSAAYAKARRLLILFGTTEGEVKLLFARHGALAATAVLKEGSIDRETLKDAIERVFHTPAGSASGPEVVLADAPLGGDARELLSSWIEAHREGAVAVDVDLCAGPAHAAKLAAEYAADILAGSPRVIRV